eukprot:413776_1
MKSNDRTEVVPGSSPTLSIDENDTANTPSDSESVSPTLPVELYRTEPNIYALTTKTKVSMYTHVTRKRVIAVLSKIPNLSALLTAQLKEMPVHLLSTPSHDYYPEEWLNDLKQAEIVISDPAGLGAFSNYLPSIQWCQSTFAGPDATITTIKNTPNLLQLVENNTLQITRIGSKLSMPMSEYVLSMIIRIERRFDLLYTHQSNNEWTSDTYNAMGYKTIKQLRFGIFGIGDIGLTIAKSLKYGFNAQYIVGLSKTSKSNDTEYESVFNKCYVLEELDTLLQNEELDYIICALPSTKDTQYLLDNERLAMCKSKPWIINIGRGDLIETSQLILALDSHTISGAVLDVFENEPLDANSSLWSRDNVIVTPHISGLTFADDVVDVFMGNLERYLNQQPLRYLVDIHKGY